MRDTTRRVMKDRLAYLNSEIDTWNTQISMAQDQLAAAKTRRDEYKAERDLVKTELDREPEPEVNPLEKEPT